MATAEYTEVKYPTTASFVITVALAVWIAEESRRRGISKSALVVSILEAVRNGREWESAA